ncbi:hypothetical protein F66182_5926 [Fusarium sp. NRRL 66182]|nr:hypothetical protein F66182_5926 [Fusarium sp. NRRL 66182]
MLQPRAYLTGRAIGDDYHFFHAVAGQTFPNGRNTMITYTEEMGDPMAFPFHHDCYDQFNVALSPKPVDLDALYETFKSLSKGGYASSLKLEYGDINECMGQFWATQIGIEDFVTSPSSNKALVEYYHSLIKDAPRKEEDTPHASHLLEPWLYDFPSHDAPGLDVDWIAKKLDLVSSREKKIGRQLDEIKGERENEPRTRGRQEQHNWGLVVRDWSDMNLTLTNRRRIWGVLQQVLDLYHAREA